MDLAQRLVVKGGKNEREIAENFKLADCGIFLVQLM